MRLSVGKGRWKNDYNTNRNNVDICWLTNDKEWVTKIISVILNKETLEVLCNSIYRERRNTIT